MPTGTSSVTDMKHKLASSICADQDEIYQADQEEADYNALSTEDDSDAIRGEVDGEGLQATFIEKVVGGGNNQFR